MLKSNRKSRHWDGERGRMKMMYTVALVLLVIGGLNWGLVGLLDLDLVAMLLGDMSLLARVVYTLVGVSALVVGAKTFMKME